MKSFLYILPMFYQQEDFIELTIYGLFASCDQGAINFGVISKLREGVLKIKQEQSITTHKIVFSSTKPKQKEQ